MRTAILFTGQKRTLARVLPLLKQNLLDTNHVTLFFACEGEGIVESFEGYEVGGADIRSSFRTPEFELILGTIVDRPGVSEEVFERSRKADGICWTIDYVRSSGTVLQYYQVWKAYCLMLEYERRNNMRFDVCVRTRLDMLLTEPLSLEEFVTQTHTTEDARSLGSPRIRDHNRLCIPDTYEHPRGTPPTDRIVWTFGPEQIWICRRDVFDVFGPMVLSYGLYDSKKPFSFNSETFFHETCKQHSIVHYAFLEEGNPFFIHYPGTEPIFDCTWVVALIR
jgi:hypothetical protein